MTRTPKRHYDGGFGGLAIPSGQTFSQDFLSPRVEQSRRAVGHCGHCAYRQSPLIGEELCDVGLRPLGSCGAPRTAMDIVILAEDGTRKPPGETGEICVRGPAVFAGYFENPEANEKAFRFGCFHTGDLGHLDERGFLYVTGRASDMYISGGSNVYPREVEEAILTCPGVVECAVVGMPHPKWGEAGVACVVGAVSEGDVLAHLAGRIARYKQPQRVVVWEALPKSGYGKVPKRLVQEKLREDGVTF